MSNGLLLVVVPLVLSSLLYAVLAVGYYAAAGRPGMALVFTGYVIANVGFIWDALAAAPN